MSYLPEAESGRRRATFILLFRTVLRTNGERGGSHARDRDHDTDGKPIHESLIADVGPRNRNAEARIITDEED